MHWIVIIGKVQIGKCYNRNNAYIIVIFAEYRHGRIYGSPKTPNGSR